MNKEDFLNRLRTVRKLNRKSVKGRIKKRYRKIDNELSWRLFQLFPNGWTDSQRFKGMSLIITHITVFIISMLEQNIAADDIVEELYWELRRNFKYYLGKKYLTEIVNQVIRIKLLNK